MDEVARRAYFGKYDSPGQREARDYLWYLWCGPDSPLYGKDKNAFFERSLLGDDAAELKRENYAPYYELSHDPAVCGQILAEFGLDPARGHIVNGHVPVIRAEGQTPVRADGRLFVIDGGISKAYRVKTGIAGYTLIYDSHSLRLAEHTPGESTPTVSVVEKMPRRVHIADTDTGAEIARRIDDLSALLAAYRSGEIKEQDSYN
jgi:fructose-1,6-bisphosphatase-3